MAYCILHPSLLTFVALGTLCRPITFLLDESEVELERMTATTITLGSLQAAPGHITSTALVVSMLKVAAAIAADIAASATTATKILHPNSMD